MAENKNLLGKLALGHDTSGGATPAQIAAAERYQGNTGSYVAEHNQATDILNRDSNSSRTAWEAIDQGAKDVATGVVNSVGGMATAGGVIVDNVFDTNVARTINDGLTKFNEFASGDADYARQAHDPVSQAKSAEIARINREKYGDTARGALGEFTDTLLNASGEDIFKTVGEGVGSILGIASSGGVPGAVAKIGSKAVAKKAGKETAEKQIANQAVKETSSKAVSKVEKAVEAVKDPSVLAKFGGKKELATMALIGGMEGGSAAGDFIATVYDTPYETLYETSKQFRDLISQGYTEEEARDAVAKSGALTVLAEVGIASAVMGKAVAKFEGDPLAKVAGTTALKRIGLEGIEETAQSASGSLLTNYNVQDKVDKDQSIYEGVGQESAMGLIGGVGSAGALQSPSLAIAGTATALKGAYKAGSNAVDRVSGEPKAPVSKEIYSPTNKSEALEMGEKLKGKTIEEAFELSGVKDPRMFGRSRKDYEAMTANKESKEDIKKVAKMSMLADMVNLNLSVDEAQEYSPYLTEEEISNLESMDDKGTVSPVEVYLATVKKIHDNPEEFENPQQAIAEMEDKLALTIKQKIEPFADILGDAELEGMIDTSTPQGQGLSFKLSTFREVKHPNPEGLKDFFDQAITGYETRRAERAKADPEQFIKDEVNIDGLFNQENITTSQLEATIQDIDLALDSLDNIDLKGNTELSNLRSRIRAMKDILEIYKATESKVETEIFNKVEVSEDGDVTNLPSIRSYLKDVHSSFAKGDQEATTEALRKMGMFIKHLRNKAIAVNNSAENYREGVTNEDGTTSKSVSKDTPYKALGAESRKLDQHGSVSMHLHSPNSVKLGRSILQNANDATEIYNLAVEAYGKDIPKNNWKPISPSERLASSKGFTPLTKLEAPKTETKPEPVQDIVQEPVQQTVQETVQEPTPVAKEEVVAEDKPVEEAVEKSEDKTEDKSEEVPAKEEPVKEEPVQETPPPTVEEKTETKEDTKEEHKPEETVVEEEDYTMDDDGENFTLAYVEESPTDDSEGYVLSPSTIEEMEDAYSEVYGEIQTIIEDNPSADTAEVMLMLDYAFKPANNQDHAVRIFLGDSAFAVPDAFDDPSKSPKRIFKDVLGSFFKSLGINDQVFREMFTATDKDGNKFFDRSRYIQFARKFATTAQAYKELGLIGRGTKLSDVDISSNSLESYSVLRAFGTALKGEPKTIFHARLNTQTSKSNNVANKELIGMKVGGENSINKNTIVEGYDFNLNRITPATFSKNPAKALWNLISRRDAKNKANKRLYKDDSEESVSSTIKALQDYHNYFNKVILSKIKEIADGFVKEQMAKRYDGRKSSPMFTIVRDKNMMPTEYSKMPFNYGVSRKTFNAFAKVDEGYGFSERFLEAFTMAAMDTIFEQTSRVAVDEDDGVTHALDGDFSDFSDGADTTSNSLVRGVAIKAMSILGLKADPNTPSGITDGTAYAIAADVIHMLSKVSIDGKYDKDGNPTNPIVKKHVEEATTYIVGERKGDNSRLEAQITFTSGKTVTSPVGRNGEVRVESSKDSQIDFEKSKIVDSDKGTVTPLGNFKTRDDSVWRGYTFNDSQFVASPFFANIQRVGTNLFTEATRKLNDPELTTKPQKVKADESVRNTVNLKMTPEDIDVIEKLNAIPNTVNKAMVNHYADADKPALAEWLYPGIFSTIKGDFTNGNIFKAKSDRAKYNTMINSIEFLVDTMYKAEDLEAQGKKAVFYNKYNKGRENRNHAAGAMNSQTNKIVREGLTSNESTIDLSVDGYTKDTYFTALAQGLGLDVTNKSRLENASNLKKFMDKFPKTREAISQNLKDGKSPINFQTLKTLIKENSDNGNPMDRTAVALHNMIDYVRFSDASTEDLKNFNTWVYLEIDGKTKGVGDSMAIFNTDPSNAPKATDKTNTIYSDDMGEYVERVYDKNNPDIYRTGASNFAKLTSGLFNTGYKAFTSLFKTVANTSNALIGGFNDSSNNKSPAKELMFGSLATALKAFDIGVNMGEEGIETTRGFAKKPVMVINYGSGASSVADTIMKLIDDEILDRVDRIAKEKSKLEANKEDTSPKAFRERALQILFENNKPYSENKKTLAELGLAKTIMDNTQYFRTDKGFKIKDPINGGFLLQLNEVKNPVNSSHLRKFFESIVANPHEFNGTYFTDVFNLSDGVTEALGNPLKEAVSAISPFTSEVLETTAAVNNFTSELIDLIFKHLVEKKLNEIKELNEKGHSRHMQNGLTPNEYQEIIDRIRDEIGLLGDGSVGIDVFGKRQENLFTQEGDEGSTVGAYTKGLSDPGSYKRMLENPAVEALGVSSSPLMTIGVEGEMVNVFKDLAPTEVFDAVVTIHDGYDISMTPYLADMLSLTMNLAAIHSWDNVDPIKATNKFNTQTYKFAKRLGFDIEDAYKKKFSNDQLSFSRSSLNNLKAISSVPRVNPSTNGIITSGMNGADIPVQVTKDGKTNVVPLMELAYIAKHTGKDIDLRAIALSGAVEPVTYTIEELGESLRDGSFEKEAIRKYEEGLVDIDKLSKRVTETPKSPNSEKKSSTMSEAIKAVEQKELKSSTILNKYIMAGYKGDSSKHTRSKARAFRNMINSPLFNGVKFVESNDLGTSNNGRERFGRYDATTNTIYLNSKYAGTVSGADTAYHEAVHVATVGLIKKLLTGDLSEYDAKTQKILNMSFDNLKDIIDAIHDVDATGEESAFGVFKETYIPKKSKDMSPKELGIAIAELLAHGSTREDIMKGIDKGKLSKESSERINAVKRLVKGVNDFIKVLFRMLGIKDLKEINSLSKEVVFNKELLFRIFEGMDMNDPTPPSPEGGKPKKKKTTKANEVIQESLDLFDNIDLSVKSKAVREETQKYNRATIQVHMDTALGLGLLDSQKQAVDATALAYSIEYSKKTDPVLYTRVAESYDKAIQSMKVSDFVDPNNTSKEELIRAEARYNFIKDIPKDMGKVPVSVFASLAYSSPKIGKLLEGIVLKEAKDNKTYRDKFINAMENVADMIYDRSFKALNGEITADKHLNDLVNKLRKLNDEESLIDQASNSVNFINKYINQGNEMVLNKLSQVSSMAFEATKGLRKSNSRIVRMVGYGALAPTIFYSDRVTSDGLLDGMLKLVSGEKMFKPIRELVTDIIGRTDVTGDVYDMIKTVKAKIQALRQEYRRHIPKVLKGSFKANLSERQSTSITEAILKTDLGSLLLNNPINDVLGYVINNSSRTLKISQLENEINRLDSSNASEIITKSKELANFMINRKSAFNLLRNADQIANLTGQGIHVSKASAISPLVDQLVSLYALGHVNNEALTDVKSLIKTDTNGIKAVLEYAKGIVVADVDSRYATDFSKDNRLKGFIPLENNSSNTIVEVPLKDIQTYKNRGYKEIDRDVFGNAYMVIDVKANGVFHQGIIQTVRPSVGGADSSSGAISGLSYGKIITDKTKVNQISNRISMRDPKYMGYIPIYRNSSSLTPHAYQRVPSSEVLAYTDNDMDFSNILSNYLGRKVEETLAIESNIQLAKNLNSMYEKADPHSKKTDYVNIMDVKELEKDPVLKDAVKIIPPAMRKFINNHLNGKLYVRRDLLNDVTGYRMALIGDYWTGNSRVHKDFRKGVVDLVEGLVGKNAYRLLMKSQYTIQSLTSDARDIIVIRSIVVPVINMLSTIAQTIMRGVSPINAVKGSIQKSREISRYVDIRGKISKLEAERIASYDDKAKVRDITARIQFLEKSISKLSIAPLIEAGEFTSIADSEIDKGDNNIMKGGLLSYVENKVDKLPKGLSTVGKYLIISRDTVLYDALKKLTDYGDFVGKAMVYDKFIENGMDKDQALALVREEFVNYDKLQGRTRHTLENLGMAWFWNWKIRATKTFFSIIKHNPLSALLMTFSPLGGIGTPIDESLPNRIFGDKSMTASLWITQGLDSWKNLPIGYAFK